MQLFEREPLCAGAPRSDQVRDRFGLRQVHSSVQEGPPGEFPGFRGSRTRGEQDLQHRLRHAPTAVAADLHDVLARIRPRRAKDRHHHVVDRNTVDPHDPPHVKRMPGRIPQCGAAAEDRVADPQRLSPAHAHHRQSSFSWRRGDRCYRVILARVHVSHRCSNYSFPF